MRTVSSCLEDVGEFPPPDPLKLCQRCHVRQQRGLFFPHIAKSSLVYARMDHVVTLSKLMLPWPLPKTWEFLMGFQVLCRVTRIPQQKPTIPSQSSFSHAFLGFLIHAQSLQVQCCVTIHSQKISFSQIFQAEPQSCRWCRIRLAVLHGANTRPFGFGLERPNAAGIWLYDWTVQILVRIDGWCVNREDLRILGFQVLPKMIAALIPWEKMHHRRPSAF